MALTLLPQTWHRHWRCCMSNYIFLSRRIFDCQQFYHQPGTYRTLLLQPWRSHFCHKPGVDIGVAVEVLPLEKKDLWLFDALLPQGLAVLHPGNWKGRDVLYMANLFHTKIIFTLGKIWNLKSEDNRNLRNSKGLITTYVSIPGMKQYLQTSSKIFRQTQT